MKYKVSMKYVRIAPRKVRYVADLIRGKDINKALEILRCVHKRGAYFINKLLLSGINSAVEKGASKEKLKIAEIRVDEGPMLKRYRPAALGRAVMIRRRMSHITLTLEEEEKKEEKK